MRAAVAHWHAEALGGTENDIRALLARRRQQHQRHKVGSDADNHFARFQLGDQFAVIVDFAGGAHLLQQHAEDILMIEHFVGVINDHLEAEGFARVRTTSGFADGHRRQRRSGWRSSVY